jgi:hypothetical protein
MNKRSLGKTGPQVSAIGPGCIGMSDFYGPAGREDSIATIHAALVAGVTLLDTGDFYAVGHNELLIRDALPGRKRDNVVISVKFGSLRDSSGGFIGQDNRPAAVKKWLAYSLQRLGMDYIDIYRPSRLDPSVPIEDTVGHLRHPEGWRRGRALKPRARVAEVPSGATGCPVAADQATRQHAGCGDAKCRVRGRSRESHPHRPVDDLRPNPVGERAPTCPRTAGNHRRLQILQGIQAWD